MKHFNSTLFGLLLFACGQAMALPADHPANPDAAVPAFRPTDYFVQLPVLVAAETAHQHDQGTAPAAGEENINQGDAPATHDHTPAGADGAAVSDQGEGKGCKRGGGCCCCCKCCGKETDEAKSADKEGCGRMKMDMMKKGMMMDKEKSSGAKKPAAKKEEGHEAHH